MKWGSGKDSFVDSARFTKWRGTRYVYIYIYGGEGKKLRGRSKWYKLQPIPRIKVSKEQSHLFMDRSSARWTGYQVPLFKQGILPISSSPPLTDPPPSSRSFHSSPLPFFPLSLPLRPYRAIWNFYPAYLRARWKQGDGRGASQSSRLFFVRYREQVEILNERARWMLLLYFYRYFYRWVDWSSLGHDSKETIDGTRGVHCPS